MQASQPKTIYLKDYKPAPFMIDTIDLSVDIFSTHTTVNSKLVVKKHPNYLGQTQSLELNGENLVLTFIKFNGEDLPSSKYQLSPEKLVILNLTEENFTLEIQVQIDPAANKACEGFYQSGDQFCSQCEAEGFRKITYFLDRPDVMAKYTTRMSADKKKYPSLLSNGNRVSEGDLPDGRHFVEWQDPFRKPCYLFAMVAGDFDVAHDSFTTMSGRKVLLEIYVDKGNLSKTSHAMKSLKDSMSWDEITFGLEYDLEIYMIVAVDAFNAGAMENKGLNIFNSTYTLADEKSATDGDFQKIQAVIGHEYFHNWSGNRVTCRDWFQLTLKEGLTVYRDQEFSADVLSRAVKRLEDVRMMKEAQFVEDAGPLSHPIRPSSYIEINNFYTRTIYEKGAEVIRMIETLIGKQKFRQGIDKYFELFDGQAVTTEDFVHAMELASGRDLSQFQNWYSRSGTPTLKIQSHYQEGKLTLEIEQKYPVGSSATESVLHMPFKLALLTQDGKVQEEMIELKKMKESFTFVISTDPILSLNRGLSAPVIVVYDYSLKDLIHLMSFDTDPYCRYEATQKVYDSVFTKEFNSYKSSQTLRPELDPEFKAAFEKLLLDDKIDYSFKSYLLDLPSESTIAQEMEAPDFDAIHLVHRHLQKKIGQTFEAWFLKEHEKLSRAETFELTPRAYGNRALKNQCLNYLVASESQKGQECLKNHFEQATNMTEEIYGLCQYILSGVGLDHPAVVGFYEKWKHDSLVMIKWFGALASYSPKKDALKRMEILEKDALFQKDLPNYLRALYMQFARYNLDSFHAEDGSAYKFLAERIKVIDGFNPQVASKSASAYALINRVDPKRRESMKSALNSIMKGKTSQDTFEVVSKYLG